MPYWIGVSRPASKVNAKGRRPEHRFGLGLVVTDDHGACGEIADPLAAPADQGRHDRGQTTGWKEELEGTDDRADGRVTKGDRCALDRDHAQPEGPLAHRLSVPERFDGRISEDDEEQADQADHQTGAPVDGGEDAEEHDQAQGRRPLDQHVDHLRQHPAADPRRSKLEQHGLRCDDGRQVRRPQRCRITDGGTAARG